MSDDLVKQRKVTEGEGCPEASSLIKWVVETELAKHIEELEERLKAATDDAKEAEDYVAELEAKLAKAEKLVSEFENCLEVLTKEDDYVCCTGYQCGCYGASKHAEAIYYANEALTTYRKFTGGKDE